MTMKFTTSRMLNTIRPITTSPPIRKPPNAATTWPAASMPSLPCDRISRVVATFSDRRNSVVSSSNVGKLEKSSGRFRNSATISTSTDAVIDSDNPRSSRNVGSGMTSTDSSATTPRASPTSLPGAYWRTVVRTLAGIRSPSPAMSVRPEIRRRDIRANAGGGTETPCARVIAQLVAQRADGNPQDRRRVGAIAQSMTERFDDQVAFDVVHAAADQRGDPGGLTGADGGRPRRRRAGSVPRPRPRSPARRPAARRGG